MRVKFRIKKVDMAGAVSKVGRIAKDSGFGVYAANQAGILMSKYVPEMNRVLVNYMAEPWRVVYDQPYAAYQYNGVSRSGKGLNYRKPTATSKWDSHINIDAFAARLQAYIKARG